MGKEGKSVNLNLLVLFELVNLWYTRISGIRLTIKKVCSTVRSSWRKWEREKESGNQENISMLYKCQLHDCLLTCDFLIVFDFLNQLSDSIAAMHVVLASHWGQAYQIGTPFYLYINKKLNLLMFWHNLTENIKKEISIKQS